MKKHIVSQSTGLAALCLVSLVAGCVAPPVAPFRYTVVRPPPVYMNPLAPVAVAYSSPVVMPVISVYIDPPMVQPELIAVSWAPPPMLVEVPPPAPFAVAVWTGGYWDWHDRWVWSAGRWMAPPQSGYGWVQPYYEHRDNAVLFVSGYWSAPGLRFVPPPLGIAFAFAALGAGVVAGPPPIGPQGVFVPPPPGSRPGLIVPAPIGTPPAVVTSAPPVTNVGMRIQNTTINNSYSKSSNVINNVTNTTNVTNITNTRNFMVTAPAAATTSGKPFEAAVPAAAHLAAALPPVMRFEAPVPASMKSVAAFKVGRAPAPLPAAQMVRTETLSASPAAAAAAASVQRPEPEHRQVAASPALLQEAPRVSRVSEERIEAAKQANLQRAAQPAAQQPAAPPVRPAPANKAAPPNIVAHAPSPPERLADHAPPPSRPAVRPPPVRHPAERSEPEPKKD